MNVTPDAIREALALVPHRQTCPAGWRLSGPSQCNCHRSLVGLILEQAARDMELEHGDENQVCGARDGDYGCCTLPKGHGRNSLWHQEWRDDPFGEPQLWAEWRGALP